MVGEYGLSLIEDGMMFKSSVAAKPKPILGNR